MVYMLEYIYFPRLTKAVRFVHVRPSFQTSDPHHSTIRDPALSRLNSATPSIS